MPKKKIAFDPADREFPFSRTALDEFLNCRRCFYQSRRLGFSRPGGFFSRLPNVVDELLKREFDVYRERQEPHPSMRELPGDLVPFGHPELDQWRHNFTGVRMLHEPSGLLVYGAVDDIWIDRTTQELHVVDYKTSSKTGEITEAGENYARQVEVYQWLLRQKGFAVSDTAYFVFEQPDHEAIGLNQVLRFVVTVVPHVGDTGWVEETLLAARACMEDGLPEADPKCKLCTWVEKVSG